METKKIQKTFEQLMEIDSLVAKLYRKNPDIKESKFGYAYTKFYKKNVGPTMTKFQEELNDIRINHALENETTKAVILDEKSPRGFAYSKDGLKNVIKAENDKEKEFYKKDIEIEPYISAMIPKELSDEDKELLKGLVI